MYLGLASAALHVLDGYSPQQSIYCLTVQNRSTVWLLVAIIIVANNKDKSSLIARSEVVIRGTAKSFQVRNNNPLGTSILDII